jgi:hypothetical protein
MKAQKNMAKGWKCIRKRQVLRQERYNKCSSSVTDKD